MARAARRYTPRIHGVAMTALRRTAELLGEAGLGPSRESPEGHAFSPPLPGVRAVRLGFAHRRSFLGGVYRTVLTAEIESRLALAGPLRLHYAGLLLKGAPALRPGRPADPSRPDPAAALLNADAGLTRLLAQQDIERLTLSPGPGEGLLTLSFSPIGGSFVWMLVPPVKYAVSLPRGHAAAMVETVARLAALAGPAGPAGTGAPGAAGAAAPEADPEQTPFGAGGRASRPHEHTAQEQT